MSTQQSNGGPAFPNITPDMPVDGSPGMTLRDWFAAMALAGTFARSEQPGYTDIAEECYAMADVMLVCRLRVACGEMVLHTLLNAVVDADSGMEFDPFVKKYGFSPAQLIPLLKSRLDVICKA